MISQGKVVALDRIGEVGNETILVTHRLTTNCAKNYCNRTLIVIENVVTCFLGTQCSTLGIDEFSLILFNQILL